MAGLRDVVVFVLVLGMTCVAGHVEELDDRFNEYRKTEAWLVEFYTPWCEYCKTFEPVWYEVGAELKSSGALVNVGKLDTSVYTDAVKEFNIRGYPSIVLVKGNKPYDYRGPMMKDAILEFTNRVSGPSVRALASLQLFQHALNHHQLFFLYVGGRSPLKSQFYKAAAKFIIHNYFFSASEEVLPQAVRLQNVPSVAVFKDETYFIYNEERDGDLSVWVDRERFPLYFQMDSFTLYELGERDQLVALAVVDEKNPCEESVRYKTLMKQVAAEHYSLNFQFGYIDGNDYINGIIMGELAMPSLIVMNMSIDGYYLPERKVMTAEDLLQFLNLILTGEAELQGGNGFLQRMKRLVYRATAAIKTSFASAPYVTCFMFSLPVGMIGVILVGICTAERVAEDQGADGDRAHRKMMKKPDRKKKD